MSLMDAVNREAKPSLLQIHPTDNVAVALRPLNIGEQVRCGMADIIVLEDVPQGHKVALRKMSKGDLVIKYGAPIGHVVCDCPAARR